MTRRGSGAALRSARASMRPRLIAVDDEVLAWALSSGEAASMRPRLIAVDDEAGREARPGDDPRASMRPRLIAVDDHR